MMEKISLTGIVTSFEKKEYHCKLNISPSEGISLTIYTKSYESFHHMSFIKYLHCFMEDGTWWTLLSLTSFRSNISFPGLSILEFEAVWAIKKAYADSLEGVKVYEAAIKIEGLQHWLHQSGFHDHDFKMENRSAIKYTQPGDIKLLNLPDKLDVSINYCFTDNAVVNYTFSLEQSVEVHFVFHNEFITGLDKTTEIINDFLGFFDLIWGGHPQKTSFVIAIKDDKTGDFFTSEVYYRQRKGKYALRDTYDYSLVGFEDLAGQITEIFQSWFEIINQIKPVINIVKEYKLKGSELTTNSFLNLVQALETFHRRLRKNEVLTREEFKLIKERILSSTLDEDKEWLRGKLSFANEPTLGNRLDDLFGEIAPEIIELILHNSELFKKIVVDNRNYFTHFDRRYEKNKVLPLHQFFLINEKLYWLSVFLVLKEVGINYDIFILFLEKNKHGLAAVRELSSIAKAAF